MFAVPPRDDFDHRLVKALDHPLRARFLELLSEQDSLAPSQALALLRSPALTLAEITYHVRVLLQLGFIEPAGRGESGGGPSFRSASQV
jgi:hypothetical protein